MSCEKTPQNVYLPDESEPRSREWLNLIADRNPFYMISGVLMLVGCYLINLAVQEDVEQSGILLMLGMLVMLTLYQVAIIAMGLYLVHKKPRFMRDAAFLLVLALVLLADVGLLYAETATLSLAVGAAATFVGIAVGISMLSFITLKLDIQLHAITWAATIASLVIAMALPYVCHYVNHHYLLDVTHIYAMWWLIAAAIYAFSFAPQSLQFADTRAASGFKNKFVPWICWTPVASMILHLGVLQWVYEIPWHIAMASPLVLAFTAVLVCPARLPKLYGKPQLIVAAGFYLALIFCLSSPWMLSARIYGVFVTPMGITAGVGTLIMIQMMIVQQGWWLALPVVANIGAGAASIRILRLWVERVAQAVVDVIAMVIPTSKLHWGIIAVVVAFTMLGLGAAMSLLHKETHSDDCTTDAQADESIKLE